ncbi:MAG: hypothetical protein DWQ04_34615 [Chloroflexi bacterium]|nr:MAG: hypothetical protein DWQ04_34615 [Chloroflexota bacterium]
MGAALTFWIDSSDMETVRWENPHVDNGIITNDGNNNLVVHDPALNPWQGTLLAVRIVRIFSVLLGAATVYLTYHIAKMVAPDRSEVVLGATAVTAFTPMFLFISGAVNNDNLIVPLAALALLMMIKVVGGEQSTINGQQSTDNGSRITDYGLPLTVYCLLLGIVIGLAALTKLSGIGLLPLAWGTLVIVGWQRSEKDGRVTAVFRIMLKASLQFLLVLLPVLLIAGWWYWRNVQLYDDWRGWTAFIAVLGQRAHPASLRQLWAERWGFMLSFWGLFGGVNIPMWTWIYHVLNATVVAGVVGFVVYVGKEIRKGQGARGKGQGHLLATRNWQLANLFNLVEHYFPLVICLLWAGAVVYGIVDWATITWSSQGRLVFSALPALATLLVLGLVGWMSARLARRVVRTLAGFMFVIAALAPFLWIRPAYQAGQFTAPWLVPQSINANFSDKLMLSRFEVGKTAVSQNKTSYLPGDTIDLMLHWDVQEAMSENWSVFVHLNDPVLGKPVAQRDMFLDQGLRPTSLLQAGETIYNYYELGIPKTAVSPAELELFVGLYNFQTGERLPLDDGRDAILLDRLTLEPAPGDYPNSVNVNFEDELQLLGFDVNPRRVQRGEPVTLTLYWQAKRPLTTDYTFFAQVVDDDTTRWAAHDMAPPSPTSTWAEDEVRSITLTLTPDDETPPDVYPIIIGMYTVVDGNFERLQIIAEDGRPTDDFLMLTLLRVE